MFWESGSRILAFVRSRKHGCNFLHSTLELDGWIEDGTLPQGWMDGFKIKLYHMAGWHPGKVKFVYMYKFVSTFQVGSIAVSCN